MGSEMNNINDGITSFQPPEPTLCANGCGFFGSSATMDLCSKCFRNLRNEEEKAKVAVDRLMNHSMQIKSQRKTDALIVSESKILATEEEEDVVVGRSNRCLSCKKKLGVMGFKCRCGSTFCGNHRYPEIHNCMFDFKGQGKKLIEKANPIIKRDKLETRI